MESLVQLGEVFGDSSVWTFRRDRPNPTMLKKCKNRDWTNLAKAWQKLADSGEAESQRLEHQGGADFRTIWAFLGSGQLGASKQESTIMNRSCILGLAFFFAVTTVHMCS